MKSSKDVVVIALFVGAMGLALVAAFATPAQASIGCNPAQGNWCQEGQCCEPYWPEIDFCQDAFDDCASNAYPDPPGQICYDQYDDCIDDTNEIRDYCLDHFEGIGWCYEP